MAGLNWKFSGDLVLIQAFAVERDYETKDHEEGAVETSEVAKEVEESVCLPRVGHLAFGHPYLYFKERVLYIATLREFDIEVLLNCRC